MGLGANTETTERPSTPTEAWCELRSGNERFVSGKPKHPNQGADRRHRLAAGQRPFSTLFGCSDSRVAAEVIFDQGLGDMFVVRTAGHVAGPTELGSLEFGAEILEIPLIIVLGHDSCGAVTSTMDAFESGRMPGGFLRDLVERVTPSVNAAMRKGADSVDAIVAEHVKQTVHLIEQRSRVVAERVADGRLAIVGLVYKLAEGNAHVVSMLGHVEGLTEDQRQVAPGVADPLPTAIPIEQTHR